MYLIDTNVISASAPTKKQAAFQNFVDWIRTNTDRIFISSITIAEIERGIAQLDRIEASTKAARLRQWLLAVEHLYAGRIVPFDTLAARKAGPMLDRARGFDMGFADIAIASIAEAHSLVVLTANRKDFAPLGVAVINPFEELLP